MRTLPKCRWEVLTVRNPTAMTNKMEARGAVSLKGRDMRYILRRLWDYLYRERLLLVLVLFLVVAGNVLALFGPRLAGLAIGEIGDAGSHVNMPKVMYYVVCMAVCYVISAAFTYIQEIMMIRITQRIVKKMRKDVFDRLTVLPVGFYDTRQTGDILSVISYDINTVNESISHDFVQICSSVITIVGSFAMMMFIQPVLVLVFVITIPISIVFTRVMTRVVRPLFRRRSASLGQMNGYAEEMLAGQKTTRAYNREEQVIDRFEQFNADAATAYHRATGMSVVTGPTVTFINNLSLTLVSVFGSVLYLMKYIGLDGLSSFVLYSRKFSGPINEIANMYSELQSALAAAERVFRLIDEKPEPADAPDAKALVEPRGEVELSHVSFGYTPERLILKDLSLHADPGSLIAIVGPTGAGKTTIINLLMRFYDVNSGSILVDGQDIYGLTRESLRRAYTMVLQDTWLFYGTIFDNIAYGKPDATMEEVVAAAKAAHIHNFIRRLPQGYETLLSDDGVNISKGQKQLLTIARAMLIKSNMLILDEATSNVDSETEQEIQDAMQALMRGKTSFVIAHRLSTVQNADMILVVRDGNVVERGTHAQLLAAKGFYYELYNAQFEQ